DSRHMVRAADRRRDSPAERAVARAAHRRNERDAVRPASHRSRGPVVTCPQLLVSVRNAQEAREALRGGADWIDLKEPFYGPLGAVDAATAREVVALVDGRAPVSAAAGELADWNGKAREMLDVSGVTHLKLGLAGCAELAWQKHWLAAHETVAGASKSLVA